MVELVDAARLLLGGGLFVAGIVVIQLGVNLVWDGGSELWLIPMFLLGFVGTHVGVSLVIYRSWSFLLAGGMLCPR